MKYLIAIVLFITLTSFSPFKKKWIITKKENIVLYTRPANFTNTNSPTSEIIQEILDEAIFCVKDINESLKTNFNSEIKIYLYNYDEAKEQIGTNQGGGAIIEKRTVIYTYFETPAKNIELNRSFRISLHEFVHIISFLEIGFSNTRLMTEGYANAFDGTYGSKTIDGVRFRSPIKSLIHNDNILKPSELLNGTDIYEGDFYPQSGFFVQWLIEKYSLEKVNKIFILSKEGFEKEFEKITGDNFLKMEIEYIDYCKSIFDK